MSKNTITRLYTSASLLLLVFLTFKSTLFFIYALIVLGVLSLIEFLSITKKFIKRKTTFFLINVIFTLYISFFFLNILIFYGDLQTKLIIFSLLLCCVSSDVGGFLFGKIIKGPKLTKISPNKTIAGAIGSIFLSCLTLSLIFYLLTNSFQIKIVLVAILTSLGCQIGDLFFSYLKRKAKIKDTGNFLPGHGGILDRLDGLILGIPVGILTFIYIY